jgi:vacuolar-type H+-ATPase subunit E/Vma4
MSDRLDVPAAAAALGPVREALLARAHAEANELVRAAQSEAEAQVARAETQARAVVDEARREGEADAAAALAAERARARRRARALVLRAQRSVYEALREASRMGALSLQDEPAWPMMRQRLVARARDLLGPEAEIREVPGGITSRQGPRRVDLTVTSLADAHVAALGPEVEKLWLP